MPPRKRARRRPTPRALSKYLDVELPAEAFCISGVFVLLQAADPALVRLVRTHWGSFRVPLSGVRRAHAVFQFPAESCPETLGKPQYYVNEHFLFLTDRQRYLLTGYLYEHPWQFHCRPLRGWEPDFIYYYLFEPILLDLLKRLGVLVWHSAAVVRDGAAVLLPGVSGSGKSTTTLNLLSLGYRFLADDVVLLRARGAELEAAGQESSLYLTDESLRLLPEWGKLARGRRRKGRRWKHQIDLTRLRPKKSAAPAPVKFLLFPHLTGRRETRLEKLTQARALMECLAQVPKEYPASLLGPSALRGLFDIYSTLVRSARCYRIHLGTDQQQVREVLSRLRVAS